MIDGGKLAKLTEHIVLSVINFNFKLQNKSEHAFHRLNAFNVKLQLALAVTWHCVYFK